MKRIKLVIAYDGTNYSGWQVQPGKTTIEGVVNKALSELLNEEITVIGASRTDAGVHAKGNVAVFDTNSPIPPEKICYAVNRYLPWDIRVLSSMEVPADFHPRKVNSKKTYEYKIMNREIAIPTERLYSYFIYYNMDIKAMQEAAKYLIGEHDFKSFCSVKTQVSETVRTIYSLNVDKYGEMIKITVTGNGFLYNMVRIIAGTLIEVGRGLKTPEDMDKILKGRNRRLAGPTAPAHGLTLVGIEYDMDAFLLE
ncbi:tRNA pseudouridine38-40 synthase [Herbinix hemicellulosilytica]|uniref:tRNA pseudouridine synthase A n=1 Tax=Herbinix hemicellulosilytica TaxID=1564487 RepID=A0A0H5SIB6_HERHM|nr:tRNA pseudouridine(38-40) synthase TruA [Herbinix hemicellulosilytica]RBP59836.1 tRNA pseudouridine38-40 synthase [Herbinix hemicellulosilytica]CRZ35224.1 tRNA pseudouridine synthase A [Herbinix hemicellulosilytica]